MTEFDPVLAMRVAIRIRHIEPLAAELLKAAVEELTQQELERVDLEMHS